MHNQLSSYRILLLYPVLLHGPVSGIGILMYEIGELCRINFSGASELCFQSLSPPPCGWLLSVWWRSSL